MLREPITLAHLLTLSLFLCLFLSFFVPIINRSRQVYQTIFSVLTELI